MCCRPLRAHAAPACADITSVARCQKKIATAGADYGKKVFISTIRWTESVAECQVQCDLGVFGPSWDDSGPPCCDSDDRASNATFDAFSQATADGLATYSQQTSDQVLAPRTAVTIVGWALLLLCLAAAGLAARGFGQRLEEYR